MADTTEIINTPDSSADYNLVNIEQSNINESLLANDIRVAIDEFCDIIVGSSIFNTNVNQKGIKSMLVAFFEDLYITEPADVLNYIGQKPSGKLINTIFQKYGIDDKYTKEYPALLKTKTAYMLNNLTATKGSIETFKYFNDILSEFYKDINFYKVVVDVKNIGNRYDTSRILYKYYATDNVLNSKYLNEDGKTYPVPSSINDDDIELKYYVSYNKVTNKIEYSIKVVPIDEPSYYNFIEKRMFTEQERAIAKDEYEKKIYSSNIYLKFDTMDESEPPIIIPRGQSTYVYKKLAFDTSAIVEYNNVELISCFYDNPSYYDLTSKNQLLGQLDHKIECQITPFITPARDNIKAKVRYVIDFGKAHPYDIIFALNKTSSRAPNGTWVYNYLTLKEGQTKFDTGDIELTAEELKYEANDHQKTRTYNDLVFRLEPILINDPKNIQTEVNSSILLSRKYLMSKIDFFDQDVDNLYKRNVFPIVTNVIHMQLGSSVTIDNTKMHPDLIRMYGMTYLNDNKVMKFMINNEIYKLDIQDYVDVLSYLKMKQLKITTGSDFVNANPLDYYYQYKLPIDKLKDIYDLHLYYMGMPLQKSYVQEFNSMFNELLFTKNQQVVPTILKMDDFIKHFKGTAPTSLKQLYTDIDASFPIGVIFAEGRDQNLQLINTINKIKTQYSIADENVDEFFKILSTISIEDSLTTNSIYDSIKSKFSIKYPRLVANIESVKTVDEIIELYLYNYKVALEYVSKMDNLVEYFINDLYQLYIQSTAFKKRFFTPVLNLFEQYFFKAEQIYRSEQGLSELIKDKTNSLLTDDDFAIQVHREKVYSIVFKREKFEIMVEHKQIDNKIKTELNDKFDIEVIDNTNTVKSTYNQNSSKWNEYYYNQDLNVWEDLIYDSVLKYWYVLRVDPVYEVQSKWKYDPIFKTLTKIE